MARFPGRVPGHMKSLFEMGTAPTVIQHRPNAEPPAPAVLELNSQPRSRRNRSKYDPRPNVAKVHRRHDALLAKTMTDDERRMIHQNGYLFRPGALRELMSGLTRRSPKARKQGRRR